MSTGLAEKITAHQPSSAMSTGVPRGCIAHQPSSAMKHRGDWKEHCTSGIECKEAPEMLKTALHINHRMQFNTGVVGTDHCTFAIECNEAPELWKEHCTSAIGVVKHRSC